MTETIDSPSTGRTVAFDDLDAFYVHARAHRWTDGLPVIPPTPARVERMIAGSGRSGGDIVAMIPPRFGIATIEAIAVNAVMAGCEPEQMPIIVTALDAVADPEFDLYAIQATTHPCGVMVLVSGPLASTLNINARGGCYGPGPDFGANMSIGRAVRLVLLNVGGARPQVADIATQGSPAKISFCFAENHEASPWEPFHVAQGHPSDATTVTVASAEAPHNLNDHVSKSADGLLFTFSQTIATMGKNNAYIRDSDFFVVFCPEHAAVLGRSGWSRRDVQQYFFERARIPYHEWRRGGMFGMLPQPKSLDGADDAFAVPMASGPENIHVLVAGGGGRHSSWIPTFAAHSRSVTKRVDFGRTAEAEVNHQDSDRRRIEGLLSPMADTLRADGYVLDVRSTAHDHLELVVTAGPDACEDCLVPPAVFQGIVADSLAKGGVNLPPDVISVVYPSESADG